MPETTWAAIRVGSPVPTIAEKTTKPPEPRATSALVLSPAIFWFHCRSNPIADPSASARPSLATASTRPKLLATILHLLGAGVASHSAPRQSRCEPAPAREVLHHIVICRM